MIDPASRNRLAGQIMDALSGADCVESATMVLGNRIEITMIDGVRECIPNKLLMLGDEQLICQELSEIRNRWRQREAKWVKYKYEFVCPKCGARQRCRPKFYVKLMTAASVLCRTCCCHMRVERVKIS